MSVQIHFAVCNFLFCEVLILGRNSASLFQCTEWNILVFLQSILCWPILPDAHLPLVFPVIILCFLPAAIGIVHKYQRISLFSLLSSSSMCRALRCSPFATTVPCNLRGVTYSKAHLMLCCVFLPLTCTELSCCGQARHPKSIFTFLHSLIVLAMMCEPFLQTPESCHKQIWINAVVCGSLKGSSVQKRFF